MNSIAILALRAARSRAFRCSVCPQRIRMSRKLKLQESDADPCRAFGAPVSPVLAHSRQGTATKLSVGRLFDLDSDSDAPVTPGPSSLKDTSGSPSEHCSTTSSSCPSLVSTPRHSTKSKERHSDFDCVSTGKRSKSDTSAYCKPPPVPGCAWWQDLLMKVCRSSTDPSEGRRSDKQTTTWFIIARCSFHGVRGCAMPDHLSWLGARLGEGCGLDRGLVLSWRATFYFIIIVRPRGFALSFHNIQTPHPKHSPALPNPARFGGEDSEEGEDTRHSTKSINLTFTLSLGKTFSVGHILHIVLYVLQD
jgi:hypothetical protein